MHGGAAAAGAPTSPCFQRSFWHAAASCLAPAPDSAKAEANPRTKVAGDGVGLRQRATVGQHQQEGAGGDRVASIGQQLFPGPRLCQGQHVQRGVHSGRRRCSLERLRVARPGDERGHYQYFNVQQFRAMGRPIASEMAGMVPVSAGALSGGCPM